MEVVFRLNDTVCLVLLALVPAGGLFLPLLLSFLFLLAIANGSCIVHVIEQVSSASADGEIETPIYCARAEDTARAPRTAHTAKSARATATAFATAPAARATASAARVRCPLNFRSQSNGL